MDEGQERRGGPREGRGGAVVDAMCAALRGCRACASGERGSNCADAVLGGADTEAHTGQSMLAPGFVTSPSALVSTNFMPPPAAQMICMLPGWMLGEAIAAPRNNTNQASTRLAMAWVFRRVCIIERWRQASGLNW